MERNVDEFFSLHLSSEGSAVERAEARSAAMADLRRIEAKTDLFLTTHSTSKRGIQRAMDGSTESPVSRR